MYYLVSPLPSTHEARFVRKQIQYGNELFSDEHPALKDRLNAAIVAVQHELEQFSDLIETDQVEQLAKKILGLEKKKQDLLDKASYRELAKKLHPDSGGDSGEFSRLHEAMEAGDIATVSEIASAHLQHPPKLAIPDVQAMKQSPFYLYASGVRGPAIRFVCGHITHLESIIAALQAFPEEAQGGYIAANRAIHEIIALIEGS